MPRVKSLKAFLFGAIFPLLFMKLKNPADSKNIQEVLRQGLNTEFWQIIAQAIDDNIENPQEQMDSDKLFALPPDQYKLENEILKEKRRHYQKLKELPLTLISWLQNPNQNEPNLDPYHVKEDFLEK